MPGEVVGLGEQPDKVTDRHADSAAPRGIERQDAQVAGITVPLTEMHLVRNQVSGGVRQFARVFA